MGKLLSRLLITCVALGVVAIRIFRPDIRVDTTTIILIGVAISPWLSSVVKGIEVPGGLKLEYRDKGKATRTADEIVRPSMLPQYSPTLATDDYLSRLVKITPVELIALFIFLSSILKSTPSQAEVGVQWLIFGLLLFFAPFYFHALKVGRVQT